MEVAGESAAAAVIVIWYLRRASPQEKTTRMTERASSSATNSSIRRLLLTAGVCLAWTVISFNPLLKYLSHARGIIAILAGIASIALAMTVPDPFNFRQSRLPGGWFVLLFLALTLAFSVLYPISLRHTRNPGSDREDALRVELDAVRHHQYPYAAHTYLGLPPTPLPGAMLLASPFYAVGHIAWQNLFWLALFFVFAAGFFRYNATALFFLATFLLFAPSDLNDFTSGGDYLTNFFYVAIAVALFAHVLDRPLAIALPVAIFLGITLSSRAIYPVILIPLLALSLQRTTRRRTAALFTVILLAAAAVTLPILTPHPLQHLLQVLNQNSGKMRFVPAVLHPRITLPLLALLVACTSFFVRMDLPRLFLIFSASSLAILGPAMFTFNLHSRYGYFHLSVCSLAFSLWALSRYENISQALPARDAQADSHSAIS